VNPEKPQYPFSNHPIAGGTTHKNAANIKTMPAFLKLSPLGVERPPLSPREHDLKVANLETRPAAGAWSRSDLMVIGQEQPP